MDIKNILINKYIKCYEKHFKNPNRNDKTFKSVQEAGWLLDVFYPDFTKDATYYLALYNKCLINKKD